MVSIARQLDLAIEAENTDKYYRILAESRECLLRSEFDDPTTDELVSQINDGITELDNYRTVDSTKGHDSNKKLLRDITRRTANLYLRHSTVEQNIESLPVELSQLSNYDDIQSEIEDVVAPHGEMDSETIVWTMVAEDLAEQNRAATAALDLIHEQADNLTGSMGETAERLRDSRNRLMQNRAEVNQHLEDMRDRMDSFSEPGAEPTVDDADGVAEGEVEEAYNDWRASIKTDFATDGVLYLQNVETDLFSRDDVELYYTGEDPDASDITRVLNTESG